MCRWIIPPRRNCHFCQQRKRGPSSKEPALLLLMGVGTYRYMGLVSTALFAVQAQSVGRLVGRFGAWLDGPMVASGV